MVKLVKGICIWGVCFAMTLILCWEASEWLHARRYPTESAAESYLRKQLGGRTMTTAQEQLVRRAVDRDALLAMLAVDSAQKQNQSPWDALDQPPTPELDIEKFVLDKGMKGEITKLNAVPFVNSTLAVWSMLNEADPKEAKRYLDEVKKCNREEFVNVAADPSYTLIKSNLAEEYQSDFQKNQRMLTPLLAMAPTTEWNELLAKFQRAQPRVGQLLAEFGRTYGLVYMLHLDSVKELENSGLSEKEAIEFVGPNAGAIQDLKAKHVEWTVCVDRLKKNAGPMEKSLFRIACGDPAVFWLMAHDSANESSRALRILQRYAGTELPAVLLKYGKDPTQLDAAMEALIRFDNEHDPDPKKRQSAAKLLNHYQDDVAFKDSLAKHGAVLIPALSVGGPDALAQIRANPKDIYKSVDKDGKPKGTSLWTYFPGGSFAYVINEKVNGRTVTWSELGWAAADLALLVPVGGEAAVGIKALLNGERVASEGLVKTAAETAGKETEEVLIEGLGKSTVEIIPSIVGVGAALESRSVLRSAGLILIEQSGRVIAFMARTAASHPIITVGLAAAVLYGVNSSFREMVDKSASGAGHIAASIAVGIPGQIIGGVWEELQSLARRLPAPAYYSLLGVLAIVVVIVPIYLLKLLLRPVYVLTIGPILSFAKRPWAALVSKTRQLTPKSSS